MLEGFIKVEGNSIWYSVYGEDKKGTPLLVLHGGPGFVSMPQVVSDLASDRPVYFYDQLGCGKSDRATDKAYYSLEHYVNELGQVRQELQLDSVSFWQEQRGPPSAVIKGTTKGSLISTQIMSLSSSSGSP